MRNILILVFLIVICISCTIDAISQEIMIIDLSRHKSLSPRLNPNVTPIISDDYISVIDLSYSKKNRAGSKSRGFSVFLMDVEPRFFHGSEAYDVNNDSFNFNAGKYIPMINEISGKYEIDPMLIFAMIEAESGFNPFAVSSQNAMGLMQLMPDTAKSLDVIDPFDPYQNILAGVRYMRLQMDRFGDIESALAAYNAGPGAVQTYGGIPPYKETQNYVKIIMDRYNKFSR